MRSAARPAILLAAAVLAMPAGSMAQPRTEAQTQPREGFYVLALSWSPTHCADPAMARRDTAQCQAARPYAFVVHGLWPQHERGYPRACQTRELGPTSRQVDSMLDIMPSRRLVRIQWERHGTCSGLDAARYLSETRAARERVRVPAAFNAPSGWFTLSAQQIEEAFVASNPGLPRGGIAVTRDGPRLDEVRICLSRDLRFRTCREVDRRGVEDDARLGIPPVRGG